MNATELFSLRGKVARIASDASSYVTGTTLYPDGDYLQHLVRYRPHE